MRTEDLPTYEPTWTRVDDLDAGPRFWIVYNQCEGFQPAYALIQAHTATDALDIAAEIDDRISDFLHVDDICIHAVSANWAETAMVRA